MPEFIGAHEGRALFGTDPRTYDAVRPPYPEEVYTFLLETGALRENAATLELGAGSGLATRRLLELGATPLTLIEPDARFSPLLSALSSAYPAEVELIPEPFETAALPQDHYDLVAAATSFHWLEPGRALTTIAEVLRPGGSAALWWNVFQDLNRDDPFHEATREVLLPLASSPSGAPDTVPFALDTAARLRDFAKSGAFEPPDHAAYSWTLVLSTEQVGSLYATFSPIGRLPERQRSTVLDRLMAIAEREFGGRVVRNMVSPVYVAKRRAGGVYGQR